MNDGDAVAQGFGVGENGGGEEYSLGFGLELLDQVTHFAAAHGVESGHGLVEEHEFGIMQYRLADSDALQHALGELAQLHASHVAQSDLIEHLVDPLLALLCRNPGELSVIFEQLVSCQVVVEIGLFGKESDLRLYRGVGPFPAKKACRASGWEHQAHQQFQGCGFTCSIGAEEAKDLPVLNRELQRVQRALWALPPKAYAISFFQPQNFYGRECSGLAVIFHNK